MAANRRQPKTLLYPMDALVPEGADAIDAALVPFDAELVENGAERPEPV